MIARFQVALPYELSRRADDNFEPYVESFAGSDFLIYPPYQCSLQIRTAQRDSVPIRQLIERLRPTVPQRVDEVETLDGAPVILANALQIEIRNRGFDRRRESNGGDGDRLVEAFLEVSNSVIRRLRAVTQGGQLKSLGYKGEFWILEYLDDDERELPQSEEFVRRRLAGSFSWHPVPLKQSVWRAAMSLPANFNPSVWEILYQDAVMLLAEPGPALVLTAASLETLIQQALDILAAKCDVDAGLWAWVNDRDDYRKEPSVEERFDALLRIVCGRSLKDEVPLWNTFKQIKNARNSFVHSGRLFIGKQEVSLDRARDLVLEAEDVIAWVERLLPDINRRRTLQEPTTFRYRRESYPPDSNASEA